MYCTNCGEEIKGKLCLKCGVKQNKKHNFCRWCGESVAEQALICPQCCERIKPNVLSSIIRTIAEIIIVFLFSIYLIVSFGYIGKAPVYSIVLVLICLVGIILAIPKTTHWINQITHMKYKLRKLLKVALYSSFLVLFIIYVSVMGSADEYLVNKENEKIYFEAIEMIDTDPIEAKEKLMELDDFKDSEEKIEEANVKIYDQVKLFLEENSLDKAYEFFGALPADYEDSLNLKKELQYQSAQKYMQGNNYKEAQKLLQGLGDYKDAKQILAADVFALIGNKYDVEIEVKKVGYNLVYNIERLSFDGEKVGWHTAIWKKTPYASSYEETESIDNELELSVKDGSIYLSMNDKDVKLTVVNYEKGRVLAFIWNGSLFKLTE